MPFSGAARSPADDATITPFAASRRARLNLANAGPSVKKHRNVFVHWESLHQEKSDLLPALVAWSVVNSRQLSIKYKVELPY